MKYVPSVHLLVGSFESTALLPACHKGDGTHGTTALDQVTCRTCRKTVAFKRARSRAGAIRSPSILQRPELEP